MAKSPFGYLSHLNGSAKSQVFNEGAELVEQLDSRPWIVRKFFSGDLKSQIRSKEKDLKLVSGETRSARAATALGLGAVGGAYLYSRENSKQKGLDAKTNRIEMDAELVRQGEKRVVNSMLHDPKYPLDAKLRILENTGVMKLSSLKKR